MDWRDQGFVLRARKHGETSVILDVFTREHGRHAGVLRGGTSRKMTPVIQPGAQIDVAWHARLEDHIGSYKVEPIRSRAAVISDRYALAGLNAVTALIGFCLAEREPHQALYHRSEQLLDLLGHHDVWALAYLQWELALLEEMGFGLDLRACAVTGATEGLRYVSPRSGKAVSDQGAGEWADKLLALPACMLGAGEATDAEIAQALHTTGFFLEQKVAPQMGHTPVPDARGRLVDLLIRRAQLP